MDFPISLDIQSEVPLHQQLYNEIRLAIMSGRLSKGQRVPATRALAQSLGISRSTVTLSYDYLLSEGYLQSAQGSGTFVCRQLPDELLRSPQTTSTAAQISSTFSGQALSSYGERLNTPDWLPYRGEEPKIQFSFGRPDYQHFPMRQWLQLINSHAKKSNLSLLDCPSQSKGHGPLRQALSSYLKRARAMHCDAEQIVIVNGSQQALDLVARVLIDPGETVGIEEPGYIGAQKCFQMQGAKLFPIEVDSSGILVEKLKQSSTPNLKLVYVTPSHQFPTGVSLALPRRLELLNWAEKTGTFIVEDDYDSEYRYEGRPMPALAGLPHNNTVIYIGTFSKVLFPALRLGYLVLPPHLVTIFERAKWLADRHSPLLEQQVLADFIQAGHLDRHIRRMRALYEHKRQIILEALELNFGTNVSIRGDNAGINVLVRFNTPVEDQQIIQLAYKAGVGISHTKQFYLGKNPKGEFLLNYGGLSEAEIKSGIKRLAKVIFP